MARSTSRRQFLTTLGASAAALGASAWGWPAIAGAAGRATSGAKKGGRPRCFAPPPTYFTLSQAGRELSTPIAGMSGRVRILVGSMGASSNSMVYCDPKGSLLVDVATCALGRRMVEDAMAVGGPFGDRGADHGLDAVVINTHHHMDHTGGNFALADFGARPMLAMHSVGEQRVRSSIAKYKAQAQSALRSAEQAEEGARRDMAIASARSFIERADLLSPDDFGPTRTFNEERYEIPVGETIATLHFFGAGHTDNDTVVQLHEDNVIHCGDLLFSRMHPYFADDSGATCQGWINSVSRVIDLCHEDTVLVPGHGPVCRVDELRRQMKYLMELWKAVGTEIDRGVSKADAMAKSWPFMDGLDADTIRPRAIGAVYDEILASR